MNSASPFVGRTTEAQALAVLREWTEHIAECDQCNFEGVREPKTHQPIRKCAYGRAIDSKLFDVALGCFDWRAQVTDGTQSVKEKA